MSRVRVMGISLLLAVTVCSHGWGFSWSYPTTALRFFGAPDTYGVDRPGVLVPYPDTGSVSDGIVGGDVVFLTDSADSYTPNSLFSGELELKEHPRGFRSLRINLQDGVFIGFLDTRSSLWLNPELSLPAFTGEERWAQIDLEGYRLAGSVLTGIDYSAQVVVRGSRGDMTRPPQRIELLIDGTTTAGFDFRDGSRTGEAEVERLSNGRFRFSGLSVRQSQTLAIAVQTPSGRWYREEPDITWDREASEELDNREPHQRTP